MERIGTETSALTWLSWAYSVVTLVQESQGVGKTRAEGSK